MKRFFTFLIFIFVSSFALAQSKISSGDNQISIIPQPLSIKTLAGKFTLTNATKIYADGGSTELMKIGEMLSAQLKNQTGRSLRVIGTQASSLKNVIVLTLKNAIDTLGDEGYTLSVNPDKIVIKANNPKGIFYGMQTLLQLVPPKSSAANIAIPAVNILDKPRFGWRGLMLDVGRYFYPVDFLKKFIDYMAMHKMNTFHWHLTEDHGWRIEIKKYPRLTEVGAWREGTQFDRFVKNIDKNPHGGYYTQDQIREVVAYAKDRFITIVPEIEMPGHSLAALVAYPELSCTGGPFKMPVAWGIQKDVYCAGNEQTYKFLEDVLSEIADLFPSPIIHIGGDECPKDRWKECPKCQAKIKAEGLKDEHELQSYFIKRIENFLLTKNKRIIGWDEILEGGLAPNAAVMSWRGIVGGIAAAKQHHDVVMTPTDFTYFDYYQGEPYLEPAAIGGLLTLEKVYSYEPIPEELSAEEASYIKGVQGNVWTEYIHSPEKVEYMTFPRAAALAEVAWTKPQLKNWDDFKRRMETQYQRYENAGINYAKSAYNVWHIVKVDSVAGSAAVTLKTDSYNPEIRYTTDGTEPTAQSQKYTQPFTIKLPGTVKAATFKKGKKVSDVSVGSILSNKYHNSPNK
jgi:hexosaminidase